MAEQQFDIIFRGDIVLGHNLAEVKVKLQQLFKTDTSKIDALFTGKPTPLKRGLDEATAQKYREVLLKAGAQVSVVAAVGEAQVNPAPAARPASVAASEQPAPNRPQSLAERVAIQAAEQEAENARKLALVAAQQAELEAQKAKAAAQGDFSLAPVGATLLAPSEKKPEVVRDDIDVSYLSLREAEGNLVDVGEVIQSIPTTVPELIATLAPVGELLISDNDKHELPLPVFDVSDWEVAEPGSILVNPDELPKSVPPIVPELVASLAPVGADLGQMKPIVTPVNPDISDLRLV